MLYRSLALASAVACLVFMGSTPSFASDRLTAAQIRGLFPGTFKGTVKNDKREITVAINADGSIRGRADGKYDDGRWSIEGDKFCVQWKHWSKAKKRCRYVIRDGVWYKAVKADGKVLLKFRK